MTSGDSRLSGSSDGETSKAEGPAPAQSTQSTPGEPQPVAHPPEESTRVIQMTEEQRIQEDIPWGVRIAAAWSWRALIILAMVGVAMWLLGHVMLIVISLMIAALLTSLLRPLHNLFRKAKIPRVLSAMLTLLVMIGGLFGILYMVGSQIVAGFSQMADDVMEGIYSAINWLDETGRQFGIEVSAEEFNNALREMTSWLEENSAALISGAAGVGSAATSFGVGLVLVLFAMIFFLADGARIWDFLTVFTPSKHRPAIHGAGRRGWTAVSTYMRVQVLVAAVDAVGIGLGAWLLNVPLALPIAVLVFFGGFVPVIGAFVTGALAVVLAWVAHDIITALLMLGVVLLVQQLESNVLQPIIMGKAIKIHPLAVALAVTGGTVLLGIIGALFAVPVMAFIQRFTTYLNKEEWRRDSTALEMERELREESVKRAAEREVLEAEEQASLATLKERLKATIPGFDPAKPAFAWRSGHKDNTETESTDQAANDHAEPAPRKDTEG